FEERHVLADRRQVERVRIRGRSRAGACAGLPTRDPVQAPLRHPVRARAHHRARDPVHALVRSGHLRRITRPGVALAWRAAARRPPMRAIVVDRWMEPAELTVSEVPDPVVGPGQLGVEVRAAGCNFFDILLVQGRYQVKPPFPFVPGGEIAGVVRSVGAGVRGFAPGDAVLAAVPMGGYAEQIAVPAAFAHRMPEGMTFEEGAAFPIVYPTSYAGLVYRAGLRPGETLLVHAAAGGVGLAAVQIGKALGARVIATAGGADKLHVALEAGADIGIDYTEEDFVERVKEFTGGRGADVIYDSV